MVASNKSDGIAEMTGLVAPQGRVSILQCRIVCEPDGGDSIIKRIWRDPTNAQFSFNIPDEGKLIQADQSQAIEPEAGVANHV